MKRNNGKRSNRYVADMGCSYEYGQVYLLFILEGVARRQRKWMTLAEFGEESQENMPNVSSFRSKKW